MAVARWYRDVPDQKRRVITMNIPRTAGRLGVPNWNNRTLFHGNNLEFLQAMNSETVDLIATDPPFNKGRDFHATPESLADGSSFQDRWNWAADVHEAWLKEIREGRPELFNYIWSVKGHNESLAAYLCFLAVRLYAMHRILKPTGSIYLHCDPTASHYIKQIMDIIFGVKNFQNEIVWGYGLGGSSKSKFSKKHDYILFYSKSKKYTFCKPNVPATSNMMRGKQKGMTDVWMDIPTINNRAKERIGYPTQKPIALYERIISASSNKNDIILDPFCGCATTLVAAERLGRQWIGIDLWKKSADVVINRLCKDAKLTTAGSALGDFFEQNVFYTKQIPVRTDDGETSAPVLQVINSKVKRPGMTRQQIKDKLLQDFGPGCQGCGRVFGDPDYLEIDHNQPKSAGGPDAIENRLLLCSPCNRRKSDILTVPGLRKDLRAAGKRFIKERGLIDFRNNEADWA